MLRAAALLVALGGCDVVWGLESDPVLTCEHPGTTIGLTVLADATLDGATALGTDGILRLTSGSRVLVRLRRSQLLDRISLRVAFADYAVGCQGDIAGCVPCSSSSLGMVDVYLVDNDWDEATVTGDDRTPGAPWQDTDRALVGTFPFSPTGLVRLEALDLASFEPRFVGSEIALELVGASGTDATLAAREGNECTDAAPPDPTGICDPQSACGDNDLDPCETSTCGDGIVDAGEDCDDGNYVNATTNGPTGDDCDRNCTRPRCGNGLVTGDEQCDAADPTAPVGLVCSDCMIVALCGNGSMESGESCDDDNLTDNDGCNADCKPTRCGDKLLLGTEECDDGNTATGDACDPNCTMPRCGNGVVGLNDYGQPETCDDGNRVGNDGCPKLCVCPPSDCPILD